MQRREELEALSADPNLWDNQEKAQKLMSEKNTLEASLDAYDGYVKSLDDYAEMVEFAESENDEARRAAA